MTQTFTLPVITSTGQLANIVGTFSNAAGPTSTVVFSQMSNPAAVPVVPLTTPTVQQVITALLALGLVTQSD